MREGKNRYLCNIKCIKDGDERGLLKDDGINDRWTSYFHEQFNENRMGEHKV